MMKINMGRRRMRLNRTCAILICMAVLLFGCGNSGTDQSLAADPSNVQSGETGVNEGNDEKEQEAVSDVSETEADSAEQDAVTEKESADAKEEEEAGEKEDGQVSEEEKQVGGKNEQAAEEENQTGEEDEQVSEEDEQTRIARQYRDILLQYKQIQDERLTQDEVEQSGLTTELIQHGWPFACTVDEVRYLFYDIDENGIDELFITYYGDIVDIYAYDGEKVRYIFGCPYRGISELHPGGMLSLAFSYSANRWYTKWYEYDTGFGDFFPSFEARCDDGGKTVYFEYGSIDDNREEVEKAYREMGEYPVWVYEWAAEDTEEEYENLVPKEPAVKLPEGKKLADYTAEGE
ncbi:MAG: hypothetical protein IK078_00705 [Lachnospiraceae bacterium]|nr:hypothetical protein [Lachnospiraceae bacterium]